MTLEDLGFDNDMRVHGETQDWQDFEFGRVIAEHRERYIVKTPNREYEAELLGNLRFTAESRLDLPAVGDWVTITPFDDNKAIIHAIFPRTSIIERRAVGKSGHKQVIATNVDFGLIVQAVDRDFNLNRMERYLAICNDSDIQPIVILSKVDLIEETDLAAMLEKIIQRHKDLEVVAISNTTGAGLEELKSILLKGKTYCLLGSSGVGKSSLLNKLSGIDTMKTAEISTSVNKGKHTTTHRELILMTNGSIFIDNPGMREVGIADSDEGLQLTFDEIETLSKECRFKDCSHINESGCAVLAALEMGDLDADAYDNYQKMVREKIHFESTVAEKRKKDKQFGKLYKSHIKIRKKNKY